MRCVSLALAALVATAPPTVAAAQRVSAEIRIGSGPVDGRFRVGDPNEWHSRTIVEAGRPIYGRSVYREVAVSRMHRGHGWWRNRGFRAVTVWYDLDRGRYYDHGDRYRDGLREVVIYARDGRYYDDDHARYTERHYDRRYHDRDEYEDHEDRD